MAREFQVHLNGVPVPINKVDKHIAEFLNQEYNYHEYANPFPDYAWMNWFDVIGQTIAFMDKKGTHTWEEIKQELLYKYDFLKDILEDCYFPICDMLQEEDFIPVTLLAMIYWNMA